MIYNFHTIFAIADYQKPGYTSKYPYAAMHESIGDMIDFNIVYFFN